MSAKKRTPPRDDAERREETRVAAVTPRGKATTAERRDAEDAFIVRALSKGLLILGLFDAEHREWTLDEMVAQLGLPRMTAYRMARTLQAAGYLVHDTVTGRYHLGPSMLAATYLAESYAQVASIARPYLESLVENTGESATLAVEIDGVAVCVDMVVTARPNRRDVAVGRVIGDTANAHGKVFAAFKSEEERERIARLPRQRLTPNTVTEPEALLSALEKVRRDGVAFDMEERRLGTCAVAAPVRDQLGEVVASLAVVVPTGRFGEREREMCVRAVKSNAALLSAFLGYADAERSVK